MKTYDFEVILATGTDMTEELADQLFEAGCDDGTPGVCCGVPVIGFSREADCLESAIAAPWPMSRKPAALSSESKSNRVIPGIPGTAYITHDNSVCRPRNSRSFSRCLVRLGREH